MWGVVRMHSPFWARLALRKIGYNSKMPQTRLRLCAVVGFALSLACSGNEGGGAFESGGSASTVAGGLGASGTHSSAGGGHPSGGNTVGTGGNSSGGTSSAAGHSNGLAGVGGATLNGAGGNVTSGGTGGVSGGGKAGGTGHAGGTSGGGSGSGGKGSAGSSAGGTGSAGKGSGGSNAGGAGSGGKGSGGASGSAGNSACPEVASQLCGMTAQHNQARSNVSPVPSTPLPSMSWDATTAAAAQAWADQCNFSHSAAGYGQNLYASAGGGPPTPTSVLTSWVSEVSNYDYSANTCSGTCGHYTQVVWRSSVLVGCGIKSCSTNTPFGEKFPNWYIVVCNYSPAGNNGSRPY